MREVEERIATVDELGNERTVIRTRTLATIHGPSGVVEVEQARRHTLPGFGHVYPISDNEYVVFRDRMRLVAASDIALRSTARVAADAALPQGDVAPFPEALQHSMTAPQLEGGGRPQKVAVAAGSVLVSVALAIWTLPARLDPSESAGAHMPATSEETIPTPEASTATAFPPTSPLDPPPMLTSKPVVRVKGRDLAAKESLARVALAIRPWGVVYLNGKKQGTSPPIRELKLVPGRYTVEVRNVGYTPYRETLVLRTTAPSKIAHDFVKTQTAAAKPAPSFAVVARSNTRFLSEEWPR